MNGMKTKEEIVEKLKKMDIKVLAKRTGINNRALYRIRGGASFTFETGLILIACMWD